MLWCRDRAPSEIGLTAVGQTASAKARRIAPVCAAVRRDARSAENFRTVWCVAQSAANRSLPRFPIYQRVYRESTRDIVVGSLACAETRFIFAYRTELPDRANRDFAFSAELEDVQTDT